MRKKRILISQRLDDVKEIGERRDNLDIRLGELIWNLGCTPVPVCSKITDVNSYLTELQPDGFVLSGGNDIGSKLERDHTEKTILSYSIENHIPLMGICRGMQMINNYQGGSLVDVKSHVNCKHYITGRLVGGYKREVNSFHKYAINEQTLGNELEIMAKSDDAMIEAIMHKRYHWLGIMWHPERERSVSQEDLQLFKEHFGVL
jgi:N5-(cytidine 5'-diphosphoramidyl)-L-glutamine hydrolase